MASSSPTQLQAVAVRTGWWFSGSAPHLTSLTRRSVSSIRGEQQLETHTGTPFLCNMAGTGSGGSITRRDFLQRGTKQGLYAENDGGKASSRDVQTSLRCSRCKVTLVPRENERFLSQTFFFLQAPTSVENCRWRSIGSHRLCLH